MLLKKQIQESVAQKSFINNKIVEEKRTNIIMNNNNHNRTTSREYVINFLNEFDELNMIETFEEKKYNSKIDLNIGNISSFFNKISNYKKM